MTLRTPSTITLTTTGGLLTSENTPPLTYNFAGGGDVFPYTGSFRLQQKGGNTFGVRSGDKLYVSVVNFLAVLQLVNAGGGTPAPSAATLQASLTTNANGVVAACPLLLADLTPSDIPLTDGSNYLFQGSVQLVQPMVVELSSDPKINFACGVALPIPTAPPGAASANPLGTSGLYGPNIIEFPTPAQVQIMGYLEGTEYRP